MNRVTIGAMTSAAAALLGACTWNLDMRSDDRSAEADAAEPFFVAARLTDSQRVALPGDSEMLVAVDAVGRDGRRPLTRFTTGLKGRQAPIPLGFSVEPKESTDAVYEFSAAVVAGDRLMRLTGPIVALPDDGEAGLGEVRLRSPLEVGFGQAWQCGASELMLGSVGEHIFLAVDDRLHALERVPAASGARYRSTTDPVTGVHEKGGELLLITDGETAVDCRPVAPLEPPLSGGGNEPGWHIDIDGQRMELTSDYGQTVTHAALIGTGTSGWTTRFRGLGDHGPVVAAFRRAVCRDSATGMPHPYGVAVQFEGGALSGCGGEPRDLLTASSWRVTRLGDEPVPDRTEGDDQAVDITLRFDAEGRVGGRAACNRYTAGYELGGEGLSIDRAAATKMACREPLMALEGRFLDLLAEVERFDIGDDGELILITPGSRITAVAQGL